MVREHVPGLWEMKELVGTMGIVYPAMFALRGPGNRLNCLHLLPLWSPHLLDQGLRHVGEDLSTDKCILCFSFFPLC